MAEAPKLTSLSLQDYNRELGRLSRQMAEAVQSEGRAKSVGSSPSASGDGLQSIKGFTKRFQGQVERLGVKFQRHLIFVEHGVGRGRSVDDPGGEVASRRPRPFLSTGVDRYHEKVADTVARFHADDFVKAHDQTLRTLDAASTSIKITKS